MLNVMLWDKSQLRMIEKLSIISRPIYRHSWWFAAEWLHRYLAWLCSVRTHGNSHQIYVDPQCKLALGLYKTVLR